MSMQQLGFLMAKLAGNLMINRRTFTWMYTVQWTMVEGTCSDNWAWRDVASNHMMPLYGVWWEWGAHTL